jgi:uncharacterized protein YhdP
MVRKTAVITFEVLVGLIAVTALLAGVAFWRLSAGPVDLDFLTPEIEAALSDPAAGISVEIGKTQVTWEEGRRSIDLHARDVRVHAANGEPLAALPDVALRLSLRALVQGVIAPTLIEVQGAHVSIVRLQDGSFHFGPWLEASATETSASAPDTASADMSTLIPDIVDRLLSKPTPSDPLSFLRVARIVGGRVTVDDRKLSATWTAPYADIELRRQSTGIAGEIALTLDLAGHQADLIALLDFGRESRRLDAAVQFSDLMPEAVVSLVPGLEAIGGLTMPLAGSVSASLDSSGVLQDLDFELRGADGAFNYETFFPEPLEIAELRASGTLSARDRRISIDEAFVQYGTPDAPGPSLSMSGTVQSALDGFRGDLDLDIQISARNVPADELARYWPVPLAENPRKWVLENIAKGTADAADLHATLSAPEGDFEQGILHELTGNMAYSGLDVHYLAPMPPVSGVSGTATFDKDRITFRPEGGRLGKLELRETFVEITGLVLEKELMKIDVPVVGPLSDALQLLDHRRLKLVSKLGLDPATFSGAAAARLRFDFPLLKDLSFDHIKLAALANLEQVEAEDLVLDQDVTEGSLKLALDLDGMQLTGPVVFAGIPMTIAWTESFEDKKAEQTRVDISAQRVDARGRAALGLPLEGYLSGPIGLDAVVRRNRKKISTVTATLDLRESQLDVPELVWSKPAGTAGKANVTLILDGERPVSLSALDIEAGTLRARGTADFDDKGQALARLNLRSLTVDDTDLRDVLVDFSDKGADIAFGGGVLDIEPWLGASPEKEQAEVGAPTKLTQDDSGAAPQESDEPRTPLRLKGGKLDALVFAPGRYLENVGIDLERSAAGWEKFVLEGTVPKSLWHSDKGESGADLSGDTPKVLSVNFKPNSEGGKTLLVTTPDMGAALRALNALDTVNGGRLEIVGSSDGPLPSAEFKGRIEGHDYVLVGAPNLARLLTVASLTGISDLLSGNGIRFTRLVGEFTLQDGIMHSDLMRAYGPALGLTAKGSFDFESDQTDFRGTIVPAYTVNRILGEIPLLGPLLTGGEGEGVFAATYWAKGKLGDLDVSVNPLAALAPGFLRSLFSGSSIGMDEEGALPEKIEP